MTMTTAAPLAAPDLELFEHRAARVNLLPPEVLAARRLGHVQRWLACGLAVVLLALGGLWWTAQRSVADAQVAVAAQQARSVALQQEQSRYAEGPRVQAQVARVQLAQEVAMAGDVRWYEYLDSIGVHAPATVWLTDLSVSLADSASASGAPADAVDPLAEPAIATVTFSGAGSDYADVADWLEALTAIPGLSDARYSTASATTVDGADVTTFSSTVGVTADALTHRFDRKDG